MTKRQAVIAMYIYERVIIALLVLMTAVTVAQAAYHAEPVCKPDEDPGVFTGYGSPCVAGVIGDNDVLVEGE